MILADTDVLIDALRGRDPSARRIAQAIESGSLATTAITLFELISGARTAREMQSVRRILAPLPILPLDEEASRLAGVIRVALERQGRGIGMADYLIAGIAISRSIPLLTRNREHFERVDGLVLA